MRPPSIQGSAARAAAVCVLLSSPGLAGLVRSSPAKRATAERMPTEWEDLRLDQVLAWGAGTLQVRSYNAGPGDGRLTLLNSAGKRLDQVETRRIEGVRFLERTRRPPLIEIHTEGHGTGLKYRELLWYCADRGKLEPVLEVMEWQNGFVPGGKRTAQGIHRMEHEEASVQVVNARNHSDLFRYPSWPVLRVRSTSEAWYEDTSGKVTEDAGSRVVEDQREFDPGGRAYRIVSTRVVSNTLRR